MGVGMKIQVALQKYEHIADFWVDELDVKLTDRLALFKECFEEYSGLAGLELAESDRDLARFLYFYFWFLDQRLDFESDIELATQSFSPSFGHNFGKIALLATLGGLSSKEAVDVASGMKANLLFRPIAMALITEYTRTSRLQLGIKKGVPANLGDNYLVFAALGATPEEVSLYKHLVSRVAAGEGTGVLAKCQMKYCAAPASWMVGCPLDDSKEYLCYKHKTENDLSYDTYRIIFSNSCGHYAERRDCLYVLVARDSADVALPILEPTDDDQ